ncbi:MAG TPA: TMEM198/TM7SF3 family protein [Candidatus Blautia merdigallinarum]|uniref:TMEM198/TM7SF3 family protein n=1 Tax=Candidatus Blautia merdigallinarum TaxID=2838495 RepID=A0A9D2SK90_9FIRM|nr:TMEM198/TM7SF3 family protein [Candidatus Blautia merdigallinarum]
MTMQLEQVLGILYNLWEQIPQEYMIVFTFGGAVFALLNCFMGYRLRKVWGCLLGLVTGGAGGTALGYYVLNDWMLALAAGAGCALIVCFLAWVFYKLGVFVMCTGLVYFMIISMMDSPSAGNHLIVLVIGIFAGTLALGYERQLVIAITAICGGIGGMGLLLSMTGVDSSAAQLLLGLVLAAFGAFVQAMPYMNRKKADMSLPGRRGRGLPGRRKKVVKKTVHHRNGGGRRSRDPEEDSKAANPKKTDPKKTKPKKDHFDAEDYDDEDLEEIYEAREKERQKLNMDRTQEYVVGQKQYERPKPSNNYGGQQGVGIDLDDLNRELSREIQKIYNDENS